MWLSKKYRNKANKFFIKHKNVIDKLTGKYKLRNKIFLFFDVIWDFEKEASKTVLRKSFRNNKNRERKLNQILRENKDSILITHNPPYGILDKNYAGRHVGSKIIRKAIDKNPPRVLLCGHIHESKGEKKHGKTRVYNLGSRGQYKILDV